MDGWGGTFGSKYTQRVEDLESKDIRDKFAYRLQQFLFGGIETITYKGDKLDTITREGNLYCINYKFLFTTNFYSFY